ncbi:MAG TPA: histidine--tRNA ligase [Lachnospiraceae bacterium]|nr:histidine--tRNA ligase [Lachnospiraceae bacterium]
MAFIKKPVTGMKDILPKEMVLRDYVTGVIKDTYRRFGFTPMETPCVESIENLTGKQGGENEKLIFKILKRGDKLRLSEAKEENDLADGGLRYDLTLPLARYYSAHEAELPTPFKALQMGPVWRADRPQKGRFRQFVQCDIDILGEPGNLAEIELIIATTTALSKVGFSGFTVRINDRRILKSMALYAGFDEDKIMDVFIALDKMDKIGMEGVKEELLSMGFNEETIDRYTGLFSGLNGSLKDVFSFMRGDKSEAFEGDAVDNLEEIILSVSDTGETDFNVVFDPTLVRGMGYYTGTIFEIGVEGFPGSVAGGGRYDKMVGNFTGKDTPACGFSIGFERIITILLEEDYQIPGDGDKIAFLVEKGITGEGLKKIMDEASVLRKEGNRVLVVRMNKNKKFQKENLTKEGYTEFKDFYKEPLKH